ncbi:helix-turn-helix domain-containing protein [Tumebacillus avium]|uniref:helix-turn-helix domain-containing protein n=1 Tax=Tumebacillus avium TaxID=1903704 RepID=UPI0012FE69C9|nr:helix-turn-helix domain-containing protein [Tumebacillus avium]
MGVQEIESVGQRIRRLRIERGLSQVDLAEQVGVSDRWISQIEKGKATASPELLNKVATIFKVPVMEILQQEDQYFELVSRLKLVEVLLESKSPTQAEAIIAVLGTLENLSRADQTLLQTLDGECKYQLGRYDESLAILQPLADKLESDNYRDVHILAKIRNIMGSSYFQKQHFTNAHYNYRKAYDLINQFVHFDALAAKISYNVAVTLLKQESFQESIYYFERSYCYFKENNKADELVHTTISQGIAYQHLQEFEKAIEYFNYAKALLQIKNQNRLLAIVEHTIASEITAKEDPELALEQLMKCIPILACEKDYSRMVLIYSKAAEINLRLQRWDEGSVCLNQAGELVNNYALHQEAVTGVFHRIRAEFYYKSQSFDQSLSDAFIASEIFATIGLLKEQAMALQLAVDSYHQLGHLEKALQLSKECNALLLDYSKKGI